MKGLGSGLEWTSRTYVSKDLLGDDAASGKKCRSVMSGEDCDSLRLMSCLWLI